MNPRTTYNDNSTISQLGSNITGTSEVDIGIYFAMNEDGSVIASGGLNSSASGNIPKYAGIVQIHQYINNTWTQLGDNLGGENEYDYAITNGIGTINSILTTPNSGVALNNDGTIVAIGAQQANSSSTFFGNGYAKVYKYANSTWTQLGSNITGDTNERFGGAVSLNGDGTILAISGVEYNSATGRVRIYQYNNNSWSQIGSDIIGNATGDYFGINISITESGTRIAISDSNSKIYVYDYNGSDWNQIGGEISANLKKVVISKSGNRLIGSADYGNDYIKIYEYDNDTWYQIGNGLGTASSSDSYTAIAINKYGTAIAIGADRVNSNAGITKVYSYVNGSWIESITIDGVAGDYSATCVCMNSTGDVIAQSAIRTDVPVSNCGSVSIYSISPVDYNYSENNTFIFDTSFNNNVDINGFMNLSNTLTLDNNANIENTSSQNTSDFNITFTKDDTYIQQVGNLMIGNSTDYSATHLAMNGYGNIVAIGSEIADVDGYINSGYIQTYKYNLSKHIWEKIGQILTYPDNYSYACVCALSYTGEYLVQGIYGQRIIRVFKFNDRKVRWKQIGSDIVSTETYMGDLVDINYNGTVIAIGSSNQSVAQVYRYINDDWTQIGSDIDASHQLGRIALNYYGTRMIYSCANDGALSNGLYTGRAVVYNIGESNLTQLGSKINGDGMSTTFFDNFGKYCAMNKNADSSIDGTVVAISAPTSGRTGEWYGYVKTYQYDTTSNDWIQKGSTITTTNNNSSEFGQNLVISNDGNRLTIVETNTGDLYVYTYTTDWNLLTLFDVSSTLGIRGDNASFDTITGISTTGTRLLIGDYRYSVSGMTYPGVAMVVDIGGTLSYEVVKKTMNNSVRIGLEDRYPLDWCSLDVSGNIYTTGNVYIDEADLSLNGNLHIANGNLQVGYDDSDTLSYFGHSAVGSKTSYVDQAYFGHLDQISTGTYGNYAILQDNNGATYVNSASGQLIYFRFNNTTAKTLNSSGTFDSSDDRLKTNEEFITNATATIMKLSPQIYKKYLRMDLSDDYGIQSGFIAQDIWYNAPELRHLVYPGHDASGNKVTPHELPDGVDTLQDIQDDPDYNSLGWGETEVGVDYEQIIAYLVGSIQEQHTLIHAEKTKVASLETENNNLKIQITDILHRLTTLENN